MSNPVNVDLTACFNFPTDPTLFVLKEPETLWSQVIKLVGINRGQVHLKYLN